MIQAVLELGIATIGILAGLLAFLLLWRLEHRQDASMVSFQLDVDRTRQDFQAIFAGALLMFIGYISYIYGGMTDNARYTNITRLFGIIYSLITITVFYRWLRRFK